MRNQTGVLRAAKLQIKSLDVQYDVQCDRNRNKINRPEMFHDLGCAYRGSSNRTLRVESVS